MYCHLDSDLYVEDFVVSTIVISVRCHHLGSLFCVAIILVSVDIVLTLAFALVATVSDSTHAYADQLSAFNLLM